MYTNDIENDMTRPDGKKLTARGCTSSFTRSLEQKMKGKVYHCDTNLCNFALNIMDNLSLMVMSLALVLGYVTAAP